MSDDTHCTGTALCIPFDVYMASTTPTSPQNDTNSEKSTEKQHDDSPRLSRAFLDALEWDCERLIRDRDWLGSDLLTQEVGHGTALSGPAHPPLNWKDDPFEKPETNAIPSDLDLLQPPGGSGSAPDSLETPTEL